MQHHHYGGGGSSVGLCLPKECGEQDVKIITGYYWFWLKCGSTIASSGGGGYPGGGRRLQHGGGGPTPAMLEDLLKCGQTNCPWRGPAPPPADIPMACEKEIYESGCEEKKSSKLACDLCWGEHKAKLGNCKYTSNPPFAGDVYIAALD